MVGEPRHPLRQQQRGITLETNLGGQGREAERSGEQRDRKGGFRVGSPEASACRWGQHVRHDRGSGIADDDGSADLDPLATLAMLVDNSRWATVLIDCDLRH